MTKLTQQEIEKERENFECWFLNEFKFPIVDGDRWCLDHYDNRLINIHWKPWLARAELVKGE